MLSNTAKTASQNVANDTKDAAQRAGATVREAADQIGSDARSVAHRAGAEARRVFSTAKDEFDHATEFAGGQIRQRPVQATLLALGAGLLLGALLRRR